MVQSLRHSTELLLWAVAALCLGVTAFTEIAAVGAGRSARQIGSAPLVPRDAAYSNQYAKTPAEQSRKPSVGEVIGRVEIPSLGLSAPMTDGIASSSLLRGVGHIDGTAMPGGLGTLGLAGHRDTYLRPLERVRPGMDIRVIDRTGTYHYSVDSTEIVLPEQVDVLDMRTRPELALITCYPFRFVGAAPKRFIVHAHLLSAAPDATDRAGAHLTMTRRGGLTHP